MRTKYQLEFVLVPADQGLDFFLDKRPQFNSLADARHAQAHYNEEYGALSQVWELTVNDDNRVVDAKMACGSV